MKPEVYAYRCRRCGELHYPYRMVCKKCKANEHNEFDPIPLPRNGRLLTFTEVYNLPPDFAVPKLALGIVELENGLRCLGQLKIPEPRLGMAVRAEVEVVRTGAYSRYLGLVFYPA